MLKINELYHTQEGKILIFGIILLLSYIVSSLSIYLFSIKDANNILAMTATNIFFGRAAGISYGYSSNLSDLVIVIYNIIIESILVMIIYPLFVFSWNKSLKITFLQDIFSKVKVQKIKYQDMFDKYGRYGLFIFVWFPFWMTGPVVGSIIGFLIGIKHYQTISIVLIGTSLATLVWTYFLKEIILILNQISSNGALILLVIFILFTIIIKVFKPKKNDEKESNL